MVSLGGLGKQSFLPKAFQAEASFGINHQGCVGRQGHGLGQEGQRQDVADVIGSGTRPTKSF